jgi:hypothetical protein
MDPAENQTNKLIQKIVYRIASRPYWETVSVYTNMNKKC